MGPYSCLPNTWWKLWVSKIQQTVWLFHTQINFTGLVTLKGRCVPNLVCYVRPTGQFYSAKTIMSYNLKLEIDSQ